MNVIDWPVDNERRPKGIRGDDYIAIVRQVVATDGGEEGPGARGIVRRLFGRPGVDSRKYAPTAKAKARDAKANGPRASHNRVIATRRKRQKGS